MTAPRSSAPTSPRAMRRVQYVLEITIAGLADQDARAVVQLATAGAPSGAHVRLRVGSFVPVWLDETLRPDLNWQIVAADAMTLERWHDHLGGNDL